MKCLGLGIRDELGNLSNRNSLTLVTQSEAAKLRVVFETFNANASGGTRDLQPCDDAHALCRETGCFLGSSSSTLLQLVQKCTDGDLFLRGMNVQHTIESSGQDGLDVQKYNLRLELGDTVDRSLWRAQHVALHVHS